MNAYNNFNFDERRLFSDGTPDKKKDTWDSMDDYGWTELDPGAIVAARFLDGWRVGYVQSKIESLDDWSFAIRIPYRIDGEPSEDGHDEFVARCDDVFVPKALLALDRTRPVPEVVAILGVKVSCGGFLCRPMDDPNSRRVVPFGEAEILFPKGSQPIPTETDIQGCRMTEREPKTLGVRVLEIEPVRDSYVKAVASVSLEEQFVVNGLRLVAGDNGPFVVYPYDAFRKDDEYHTVCNPVTRKLRDRIEEAVLTAYRDAT